MGPRNTNMDTPFLAQRLLVSLIQSCAGEMNEMEANCQRSLVFSGVRNHLLRSADPDPSGVNRKGVLAVLPVNARL